MKTRLQFGSWILDGESRELRGPRGAVHLSPKAFDLLAALLESRPRALSKAELHDRLWAKTLVSDSNLARVVTEVRLCLLRDGGRSGAKRHARSAHHDLPAHLRAA